MALSSEKIPGISDYLHWDPEESHKNTVAILGSSKGLKLAKRLGPEVYKIAIGDVPFRAKGLGPFDLWVTANTVFPNMSKTSHQNMILKSNCKNLALSSICFNDGPSVLDFSELPLLLAGDFPRIFAFDQRHSEGVLCNPDLNCCRIFKLFEVPITIQEFLKEKYMLADLPYSSGHTVAIHALALALLLKPKTIEILGVDLPLFNSEYTYHKPFSKIDKTYTENLGWIIRQKVSKRKILQDKSPFAGKIREELLNDFQTLINLATSEGIIVKVIGNQSSLSNLKNVETLRV